MVRKKIPAAQKGQRIVVSDEGVLLLEDIFRWNQRNHEDHEERLKGIKEMKGIGKHRQISFPNLSCSPCSSWWKYSSEVNPLLFHHQRTLQHLGVDRPDVFAQDPDKEELHRGKEEKPYDQRSRS